MEIVFGFAFLALVALLSLLLGADDPRAHTDPRNDPRIWFALARR